MNLHGTRRLARLAGCAAVAVAVAASLTAAGSPAALATGQLASFPVINQNAAVSWGHGADGSQLGDGAGAQRDLYGPVSGLGSGVVQVAAGRDHGLAVISD